MRHAFLIIAHDNFEQLALLLRLLDDGRFDFYIHIDAKATQVPWDTLKASVRQSTLLFTDRTDVVWGEGSQITSEMVLLKAAAASGKAYGYYHLLSGRDLPIKNNDEICAFFDAHAGQEFVPVEHSDVDGTLTANERSRYSLYWFDVKHWRQQPQRRFLNIVNSIERHIGIDRDRNCPLKHGKGANWFSITESLARFVIGQEPLIDRHFMHHTLCCDELFLQTVLLNSPYADNVFHPHDSGLISQSLRHIDWTRGDPYVFHSDDFAELRRSENLFARKFDLKVDDEIMELVANNIRPGVFDAWKAAAHEY